MKRKINWVWLAGFFEGDGCVACFHDKKGNKNYNALRVCISQKNLYFLKRLKKHLEKYNISGSIMEQKGHKDCYNLLYATRQAESLIQYIYPHFTTEKTISRVKRIFKEVNQTKGIKKGITSKYKYINKDKGNK